MSVYLELCEILGISLNEFLAGEDIEVTNVEKKSEDTLIQISKDSSHKQRYLKKIIAVLLIAVGVFVITLGIMVCNKLRQPQNYIEAVDPDSVEMKTAELLSGIDGTMMFRYNSKDTFQALYVYLSEYHSGKRVSHKRVLELSYEDVKSAKKGLIVITPDFDNFTAKLIAADEYSKYMTETPILEGVANREYYGDITNHCFDNSVVSSLWISEFVSQLSVFSRRISFQLVKKPAEIKLVIISDNLRNLIDGISCCFK